MSRYVLKLEKTGNLKYISHLDMIRLMKNTFKRVGIKLQYSQGFNPHPHMGFAQPLSLGYSSLCEMLEFETKEPMDSNAIKDKLNGIMPVGIEILSCENLPANGKTLAALTEKAKYLINIPIHSLDMTDIKTSCENFMLQKEIVVQKKQKKSGKMVDIDIKNMIREFSSVIVDNNLILSTTLDAGSNSNLSPELLINAFLKFAGAEIEREEIDVERVELYFAE